jgi:hypothetical protein
MLFKPMVVAVGLAVSASIAHAVTSFAGFGTPTFKLTDLDPNDGVTPSFYPYLIGSSKPVMFFDDITFRIYQDLSGAHDMMQTSGQARTFFNLGGFSGIGGTTTAPMSSFDALIFRLHGPDSYLTPNTALTISVPLRQSSDARGGAVSFEADYESRLFVGSPVNLAPQDSNLLFFARAIAPPAGYNSATDGGNPVRDFVSQMVLNIKNTSRLGGVVISNWSLRVSGHSDAIVGCARSVFGR